MTDKVVKRKIDKEKNPQAHKGRQALKHLTPADYMAAGQTSIMDASNTPEQRERRPSHRMSKVHLPAGETPDLYLGMPTRTLTKVRSGKARAKPRKRWKKCMKMRETVSVAGNATIIEDCPYCGRLCGTGYAQVIFTHGRFLRRDSASAMSFQGIVTDVEKCHTVSNWESKALISNISQSCRGIFFLSDRDSLPRMSSAEGATHGGCERTSMPSPIRRVAM